MGRESVYRYVIKRLLVLIPVLIGVTFIVFFIMNLTPGNPGRNMLGPLATQEQVDAINEQLGYNQPYFVRYFNYIKDIVLHFDFGDSYATGKPVIDQIISKFPYTLRIAVGSVLISSVIGIVLGVISAVKQYTLIDNTVTVLALIVSVMPSYWIGMLFILLFSITLGWLPPNGFTGFENYILPVATVSLNTAGPMMRMTRSVMLEELRQDYVKTIRAKGAKENTVIYSHALKNAMMPLITRIGTQFAAMMGGSVITETVFNIPGIGSYIISSINAKDIPAVMTCTLFFAALYCIIMLIMDIVYAYIDPRIREKYTRRLKGGARL